MFINERIRVNLEQLLLREANTETKGRAQRTKRKGANKGETNVDADKREWQARYKSRSPPFGSLRVVSTLCKTNAAAIGAREIWKGKPRVTRINPQGWDLVQVSDIYRICTSHAVYRLPAVDKWSQFTTQLLIREEKRAREKSPHLRASDFSRIAN